MRFPEAPHQDSRSNKVFSLFSWFMCLPSGSRSEADLDLAGNSAEVRIAEAVDAEIEIAARGNLWVEPGVVSPGVQVAADERDLHSARDAAESGAREKLLTERIAGRKLAQLHVRPILYEVVARHETVVESRREEAHCNLLISRLSGHVRVAVAHVLEHPLLGKVVD